MQSESESVYKGSELRKQFVGPERKNCIRGRRRKILYELELEGTWANWGM